MKLSSIRQAAKNVPLRRVWQTAEKAHAICGKPTAALFTDMLRCAKRYGAGPTDYMMFEFYDLNDAERSTCAVGCLREAGEQPHRRRHLQRQERLL